MPDLRTRIEKALGPGYRIERELGGGGMSRVFVAEEVGLGRRVVVKVLPPEMAEGLSAERFQREIRLVASLQHPNIVSLIAAGGADDLLWFTMPFVEGESLRARLDREGELPVGDATRLWLEMLDALAYAHGRGIVHRDIKPENVLLSGRHGLIADFGVARALSSATGAARATITGISLGTPAYMAPEQAVGDSAIDHRADIYAAGLVMYEMLTGAGPFPEKTPQRLMAPHAMQAPPSIKDRRQSVPPELEAVVMQCLAKSPADRPQSAEALMQAVAAAMPAGATSPATGTPARGTGRKRRRAWVAGGIAILAVAVFALAKVAGLGPGGVRGVVTDSARTIVGIMPTIHDPADSVLAKSAIEAIVEHLDNDERFFVGRPEQITRLGSIAGVAAGGVTRDSLLGWLPDLGVHVHFTLTLARAASGYLVSGVLKRTVRDSALLSEQVAAPTVADVPATVQRIAERVRGVLGASLGRIPDPIPDGRFLGTTADAAMLAHEGNAARDRRDWAEAADRYREATRIDSTWSWAWLRLYYSLANGGLRPDERYRALSAAFRHARRSRFPSDSIAVAAEYYRALQDVPRALDAYERLSRMQDEFLDRNNFALLYASLRRFEDARRTFARIRDSTYREPWIANTNYVQVLLDLGRLSEAEREVHLLDSIAGPSNATTRQARYFVLNARRNRVDSVAYFAREHLASATNNSQRLAAYAQLRNALVTRGQLKEALEVEESRGELLARVGSSRLGADLGHSRLRLLVWGDSADADAYATAALRRTPMRSLTPMDRPYATAIQALAVLGRVAEARQLSEEWDREIPEEFKPVFRVGMEYARGELAMAERDPKRALEHFRKADRGPCVECSHPEQSRAWDALGNADSTLYYMDRYLDAISARQGANDLLYLAAFYRRAGELLEARGEHRKAITRYQQFVDLWREADPVLQPRVTEVKARIVRLQARIS